VATNNTNKIKQLYSEQGQSTWQDDISRQMIQNGQFQERITDIGIRGVTSNPTIFQKAIAEGDAYDDEIMRLLKEGHDPVKIFEILATEDIREACDLLRPIYDESNGADGFASIEVSPGLARDTTGTLNEVRRLWNTVDRPNLMVKIPGTKEGVPAIEAALTEGININITLLFSIAHYEAVAKAYITAVERRLAKGDPIDRLASVASFFVSRIDTEADKRLEKIGSDEAKALKGKVAVANAQLAYEMFQELFESDAFKELQSKGASVQRPLWASTGTKNPAYSDVLYVDTLIGPDTVNTMPIKTMQAFLDHGTLKRTVDSDYAAARQALADLQKVGVSLDDITQQLEDEGIDKFIQSYDELLEGVAQKRSQLAEKVGAK